MKLLSCTSLSNMNLQPQISTPPNACPATLFGFRVSENALFFLSSSSSQNKCQATLVRNYSPTQQLPFSKFGQITPVISISSGSTSDIAAAVPGPKPGKKLVLRVEAYLAGRERKAKTIEEREAYQLAQSVVRRAYEGCADPYTMAFCWFYGGSPELIQWKQEYYRAWMLRETLPAKPTLKVAASTNELREALPPKKPSASVKALPKADRREA